MDLLEQIIKKSSTTGENLKNYLKLNKFKFIWIQKVINSSVPIYIIYVDSRRPSVYLSITKIKKIRSFVIKRVKGSIKNNAFKLLKPKLSIPLPLEDFNSYIPSNSFILLVDFAGEYFINMFFYEKTQKSFNLINKERLMF